MKTSNKLLLLATVILFGYLAIFNFQLRAEYLKGDFKKLYYGMKFTPLNSFTTIRHNAGNVLALRVEKGPKFGVWMRDNLKEKLALTERNNTLFVDYVDKQHSNYYSGIVVVCPEVNTVITTPLKTHQVMFWEREVTQVSGFTQDAMNIVAGKSTQIELNKNTISKLNAATTASNATIKVNAENLIQAAEFKIAGKSDLQLLSQIAKSTYSYTDSATITLNGKSFAKVNQH
ncbi:MAG: hypothetical protein V4560_13040 [Bacteroidota bacterium]|jgi:hypothetical protein